MNATVKRFIPLIAAGVAVLVVVVWYFVLYAPKNKDLSDAHEQLTTARNTEQNLRAQLSNLRGLEANRAKQQAVLQKLSSAIPATPDLASFILQANDIATQAGVDWLQVSPSLPAPGQAGQPTTINLTMQLEGGFYQVSDYLNRLEDMQRLVLVDTVNITTKSSATGNAFDPTLSVSVTGRMFTRAAAQSTSGTGGATGGGTTGGGTSGGGTATTAPSTTSSTPSSAPATTSNTSVG